MIISDTSVITNLIQIEHFFLLETLYNSVIIPQAVQRELEQSHPELLRDNRVLETRMVSDRAAVAQLQERAKLDPGESEAIILALELKADLLLIDERRGRAEAQRLGIRITGLLGVLLEGKVQGFVVAIKPLMDRLIADSTFWISPLLYERILELAGEKEA